MNKIKAGFMSFMLIFAVIIFPTNIKAEEKDLKDYNVNLSEVSPGDTINLMGEEIVLFKTFDDNLEALTNFYKDNSMFLDTIKEENNLSTLTEYNYKQYYEGFRKMMDIFYSDENTDWDSKYATELFEFERKFNIFNDTYESIENNELIVEKVNTLNAKNSQSQFRSIEKEEDKELLEDIIFSIPYFNNIVDDYVEEVREDEYIEPTITPFLSYQQATKAIAYADKHATNPNSARFGVLRGGDCANFASQIANYAGKGMTSSWRSNSSSHHTYSWAYADGFAKYWGISVSFKDFTNLSYLVNRGDFILVDFDQNGSYDHTGFVTVKNSTTKDFKVAQHTSNYHQWTSAGARGWKGYSKYVIVRP